MTIHLKPELEALIQKDVERGPYRSADEFVEQAVQMLHEQEQWLADNHADIAAKIEEGYASAERESFSTQSRCAPKSISASRPGETKANGDERCLYGRRLEIGAQVEKPAPLYTRAANLGRPADFGVLLRTAAALVLPTCGRRDGDA